jgi:phosphohistidine phosphatase
MLRLLLLRHAKATAHVASADAQRPLSRRGQKDALRIGEYLRAEDLVPAMAFVSHARRSRETLEIALRGLGGKVTVEEKKKLYLAEPRTLLDIVHETPGHVRTLLIVGHNPGLAAFAGELAGEGDPRALAGVVRSFPTSALAVLDFDVPEWAEIDLGSGRLDRLVTPSALDGEEEE